MADTNQTRVVMLSGQILRIDAEASVVASVIRDANYNLISLPRVTRAGHAWKVWINPDAVSFVEPISEHDRSDDVER